jgi:hypothetical protein
MKNTGCLLLTSQKALFANLVLIVSYWQSSVFSQASQITFQASQFVQAFESDLNSESDGLVLFEAPVRLTADGEPIAVELPGYACPTMVDWDGNGVFDLVVGQFAGGNMRRYPNVGAAGQPPRFSAGQWLMTGSGRATVPGIRCCTSSTPQFVDWNGDGKLDILSGCYATPGHPFGHLMVLFGETELKFSAPVYLVGSQGVRLQNASFDQQSDQQQTLLDSICTHQHAVDLDGDGDLDLVVGAASGKFFWYQNIGNNGQPMLKQPPTELPIQSPASRSAPHLVDWDGDGDLDLLTGGSDGGVYLSINRGTAEKPEWSEFQTLIPPTTRQHQLDGEAMVPGHSTRVWAFDWNGDGQLDLIVGDAVTILRPREGISHEFFMNKENEIRTRQAMTDEISGRLKSMPESNSAELFEKRKLQSEHGRLTFELQRFTSTRFEWAVESRTGFVWLYLRK